MSTTVCLDTCTLLWLADQPQRLSAQARLAIEDTSVRLLCSPISAWEIALKQNRGRLQLPHPVEAWWSALTTAHGIESIPVDERIAMLSVREPLPHADPADRMIVATARVHHARLLTADQTLLAHCDIAFW